jgi:hypothetical protein
VLQAAGASQESWLGPRLEATAAWLAEAMRGRPNELESWLGPRLDQLAQRLQALSPPKVEARGTDPGNKILDAEQLLAQVRRIEDTLVPVVGAAVESRAGDTLLANKMVQIIELLEMLDARLRPQ